MAHWKRGKPSTVSSGCYMCKPWKHGWTPKCAHAKASIYRRMLGADAAIREYLGR